MEGAEEILQYPAGIFIVWLCCFCLNGCSNPSECRSKVLSHLLCLELQSNYEDNRKCRKEALTKILPPHTHTSKKANIHGISHKHTSTNKIIPNIKVISPTE